jgi:hypothetical protein
MWTLDEALKLTSLSSDRVRLDELRRIYPQDRADQQTLLDLFQSARAEALALERAGDAGSANEAWKRSRAVEGRLEADRERFHEVGGAEDAIRDRFSAMMAEGRAEGVGKATASSGELVAIPAKAWSRARIDWERSALSYGRSPNRVDLVAVRVRPWLHGPDVPTLLSGRSLPEAFKRFVLGDPEFVSIVERARDCALGGYPCHCGTVLDGQFTDKDPLWPAALGEYDLLVEWMDAFGGQFAHLSPVARCGKLDKLADGSSENRHTFMVIRKAEEVVLDRMKRFLAPLRSGEIVARGEEDAYRGQSIIPAEYWSRSTVRIDFMKDEMWSFKPGAPPPTEAKWTGLVLSRREAPRVSSEVREAEQRNKGGRPPKHAWPEAYDRLAIELGKVGHPGTGAALARMMADRFNDMGVDPPAHEDIIGWLKKEKAALWAFVTRG